MKRLFLSALFTFALAAAGFGHDGQQTADKGPFTREQLTSNTYVLYGRGGNIGFVVTKDGTIVIDDQFAPVAPGILAEIKSVTDQPVKFLINTHHHGDHTGGNATFLKIAYIIAHENVRKHMLEAPAEAMKSLPVQIATAEKQISEAEKTNPSGVEQLKRNLDTLKTNLAAAVAAKAEEIPAPNITFRSEIHLYIGGEETRVFHIKRGHTDGDSVIYFPNQKVVHMGDLYFNETIPVIDRAHGADTGEWIETIDGVLSAAGDNNKFIPGHGQTSDVAGLRRFRQYLFDLRTAVASALKQNPALTREDAVKQIKLDQYSSFNGYSQRFGGNVGVVYDEMRAAKN